MIIRNQIIQEAQKIYNSRTDIEMRLLENGASGEVCKRLAYHTQIFQATTGILPTQCHTEEMKKALEKLSPTQEKFISENLEQGLSKHIIQQEFELLI